MEDAAIIELYFQRSERAVSESDKKYGRYCGTIARNILGNAEDAEECVSDTWLRAWNTIPPTRPSFLKAFFGKITRNLSLNRIEKDTAQKRGGGVTAAALDELAECVADERASNWSADGAVIKDTLNAFLKDLSRENRIVFVRRYWYFEAVKDIAKSMGFSESKTKMMLKRAREALAKKLEKEGIEV